MNNPQNSNLLNRRFDKLSVVSLLRKTRSGKIWLCICDCGNEISKVTTQLTRIKDGKTGCRSCESKSRSDSKAIHGGSRTNTTGRLRLYKTWKGMRDRCNNPGSSSWKYYGGKGISISPDWSDFQYFKDWALANGYEDHLTIDRIDPNKNYSQENCRWLTKSENCRRATSKGL